MYKLLAINGVSLPTPEGDFSITINEKYNEYEGEDGKKTIEVIRQGIKSLSVSFNGLTESDLHNIKSNISLVSRVTIYNPLNSVSESFQAKITGIKSKKIWFKNDVSVWSLSFEIDEL